MALSTVAISPADILQQIKLSYQMPGLIRAVVARRVIEAQADKLGITVAGEELQNAADQLRLMNKLEGVDATWQWLKQHGLSKAEFQQSIYLNLLAKKLAEYLFAEQVEPLFFQRRLDYEGLVFYEAVLSSQDLALELFYAILEGEISFQEVARQYIEDKELRRCGGYRGLVRRKDLRPEISAAGFAAEPPQLIKPITTARGVHLILVEEIIKPVLNDELRLNLIVELFDEWINRNSEQIEVGFNNDASAA